MNKGKKILGTICFDGKIEFEGKEIKKEYLEFEILNNGFDGEKYQSVFSFVYELESDFSIDLFFDEAEIQRVINVLKKHLKNNRKEKK